MSNIDKQALREELSNPAIGSKDHLRKLALSLLDELDVKEEQRANWFQMAQKLGEDLEAAERRVAELSASHSKLRDTMATIHNTIRMDGGYTPLAAILNAAKRAHEESATAAGIKVEES